MNNEQAIAAKEYLDACREGTSMIWSYQLERAQVHATLAVAEELSQLIRVLQERP